MCGDCVLDHDSALILPRHIEFVEALSLTVSGKIRRTEPRGGGRNGRRIACGAAGVWEGDLTEWAHRSAAPG